MSQINIDTEKIYRYLNENIARPRNRIIKFAEDIPEDGTITCDMVPDIEYVVETGVDMKVQFTAFDNSIKHKYFRESIGVTLTTMFLNDSCSNIELDATNVHLILSPSRSIKINPFDYADLTCVAIPIVSYQYAMNPNPKDGFRLIGLYISDVLK